MKVLSYHEAKEDPLKCVVTISIEKWGGFIIQDIKLFERGGARWFHFPSKYTVLDDGRKKHFEYVHFDSREIRDAFHKELFKTVSDYKLKKQREKLLKDTPL